MFKLYFKPYSFFVFVKQTIAKTLKDLTYYTLGYNQFCILLSTSIFNFKPQTFTDLHVYTMYKHDKWTV